MDSLIASGASLLLEKGRVEMVGPTDDVIRMYLRRGRQQRAVDADSVVVITDVVTHDDGGPRGEFNSGGKLRITVEARARALHPEMSVVIQIVDDHHHPVHETCTQHLGASAIRLDRDQTLQCTFELDLTFAKARFT